MDGAHISFHADICDLGTMSTLIQPRNSCNNPETLLLKRKWAKFYFDDESIAAEYTALFVYCFTLYYTLSTNYLSTTSALSWYMPSSCFPVFAAGEAGRARTFLNYWYRPFWEPFTIDQNILN